MTRTILLAFAALILPAGTANAQDLSMASFRSAASGMQPHSSWMVAAMSALASTK
jgi:hypothetical protein